MTNAVTVAGDQGGLVEFARFLRDRLNALAEEFARPEDADAGDDRIAAVEELREGHEDEVAHVRRFQAALYDAGLAWPSTHASMRRG